MKTFIKLFAALIPALILISCGEKPIDPDPVHPTDDDPVPPEGYAYVHLNADGVKAVIDGATIKWKLGDKVLVNGKEYSITVLKDGTGRVLVPVSDKYRALYPSNFITKDGGTLYLQDVQYYAAGSFGSRAYPMAGSGSGKSITMKGLCGLLKFNVKGDAAIMSVGITDNGGGKLCGTYAISGESISPKDGITSSSLTLNCITESGACATLKGDGTTFYAVVPAGTYSKGFTITISSKDNHSVRVNTASSCTVQAGGITSLQDISFNPPAEQLFAYHFDNLTLGGEPVEHNPGYGSIDPSKPSGFDFSTLAVSENTAGANCVTTVTTNHSCDLPQGYMLSRGLTNFTLLQNVQEFHGYLGCGVNGTPQADLKLPPFSCLAKGDICMAEISFRIAAQSGLCNSDIDFFHSYSTSGKMLKMWIDGALVADYTPNGKAAGGMGDATRWATGANVNGINPSSSYTIERIRIKASEIADGKWHDVKLLMGTVTPVTVIEIGAHHDPATPTTSAAFFIDDIVANRIPYESLDTPFQVSLIVSPQLNATTKSSTQMDRLKGFGEAIGISNYIDFGIGTSFFCVKNSDGTYAKDADGYYKLRPEAEITAEIKEMADKWHALGYKVWNIHMPATTPEGSYDGTIFEYFYWDTPTRLHTVEMTKTIMRCLKPFESKNLMVHATGPGRNSKDSRIYYVNARDYGVASFRALVEYANSNDMRYSDGSHPVFCIENIQNTNTNSNHVCAKPEYMNYYCEQVPGLKVCCDMSHAQVGSGMTADEYLRRLGTNLCSLHIHGNGKTTVDRHIYPGYRNGIYKSTGGDDIMDWGKIMSVLVNDCHYTGVFSYEMGTVAEDHVNSFNNVIHNYYSVVLPAYRNMK